MAGRGKREKWLYLLAEGDAKQRREAVIKLAEIPEPTITPALIAALNDESWQVRRNAAQALGNRREASAVPQLITCLRDKTLSVRRRAIRALGVISISEAVPALCGKLAKGEAKERQDALQALAEMGAPAFSGLYDFLRCPDHPMYATARSVILAMSARHAYNLPVAILEEPTLKTAERYLALEQLRRPSWKVLSAHNEITDVRRFCEQVIRYQNGPIRKGAQEVLEYMTLARASDSATLGGEELLRAAQAGTLQENGKSLLRGSSLPAMSANGEENAWLTRMLAYLRRWLLR